MFTSRKKLETVDERSYDSIHRAARDLFGFPRLFTEGLQFSLCRPLIGNNLYQTHTFALSSISPSNYIFSSTFVDVANPKSPVLTVSANSDANISCVGMLPTDSAVVKCIMRTEGTRVSTFQLDATRFFEKFTVGCKLANLNPLTRSGLIVTNLLYNGFYPGLSVGAELKYQFSPRGYVVVPTFAGRYKGENWIASGAFSHKGVLEGSFMRDLNPKTAVGTFLDVNMLYGTANAGISALYKIRGTKIYTQINSSGVVSAVIEKELTPESVKLTLSGMIDHVHSQSAFGLSFQVQM